MCIIIISIIIESDFQLELVKLGVISVAVIKENYDINKL